MLGFTGLEIEALDGPVGEFRIGLCWGLLYPTELGKFIVKEGPLWLVLWLLVLMFLFFLKSRGGASSTAPIESIFPINLLLWEIWPSSRILASWILLILFVTFSVSIYPLESILIWKSSIQLILLMGSFVNILEIKVFRKTETCPGNWSSLLLRTSIRLAMEFDWKGHIPKIISYMTTPKDQISALLE